MIILHLQNQKNKKVLNYIFNVPYFWLLILLMNLPDTIHGLRYNYESSRSFLRILWHKHSVPVKFMT